jgi:flavorubredoxin
MAPTSLLPELGAEYAVEVAPGLHAIGANISLPGPMSWVPPDARGFQPHSTYLIADGDGPPVIVDPGLSYLERPVVSSLQRLLGGDAKPVVFLTRAQLDSIGNLGALAEAFPIEDVFTGGNHNPFDSFDAVTSDERDARAGRLMFFRSPGESRLEVINPALRILATFWAYDARTKCLFTSDSFTHVTVEQADAPPVVDAANDTATIDDVRDHLVAAFWWLPAGVTHAIAAQLRALPDTYDIELIAPARGCVLRGKEVVERHLAMVVDVLEEPAT